MIGCFATLSLTETFTKKSTKNQSHNKLFLRSDRKNSCLYNNESIQLLFDNDVTKKFQPEHSDKSVNFFFLPISR